MPRDRGRQNERRLAAESWTEHLLFSWLLHLHCVLGLGSGTEQDKQNKQLPSKIMDQHSSSVDLREWREANRRRQLTGEEQHFGASRNPLILRLT